MAYGKLGTKEGREKSRNSYFAMYNARRENHPELKTEFGLYESNGRFSLIIFEGTAGKPSLHYSYSTEQRRDEAIQRQLEKMKSRAEYKQRRAAERGTTLSSHAQTAKMLRIRLKEEFPNVKFKVTSECFSGGDSVNIRWTDGPVASIVDKIAREYQKGYFDAMNDCYEYVRLNTEKIGCTGAKYVLTSREQSPERIAELKADYLSKYNDDQPNRYNEYGDFNAYYYENSKPETWPEEYRHKKAEQDAAENAARIEQEKAEREQWDREQEERAAKNEAIKAEIETIKAVQEAKQESEPQKAEQPPQKSNIVDFAAAKKRLRNEPEPEQPIDFQSEMEMTAAMMTESQLVETILTVASFPSFSDDERRTATALFLSELKKRNERLAIETFMKTPLYKK